MYNKYQQNGIRLRKTGCRFFFSQRKRTGHSSIYSVTENQFWKNFFFCRKGRIAKSLQYSGETGISFQPSGHAVFFIGAYHP